ncbi:signal peptidase I [Candidatus Woesearchaeota archaeon]|jgi:signal peptidase I|nr:MAG: signal peptidase I [Candidatus Woesearchaeota archaeon]
MRYLNTLILILIFSMGLITQSLLTQLFYVDMKSPFPVGFRGFSAPERLSPADHIKESDIGVYAHQVTIDVEGASWATFTNTNSMDPLLDETAHGIEIKPTSPDDISIGDVISYKSQSVGGYVIHRVIDKGEDEKGVYFILKGDNNPSEDPEKVRFEQVEGILVAIIY